MAKNPPQPPTMLSGQICHVLAIGAHATQRLLAPLHKRGLSDTARACGKPVGVYAPPIHPAHLNICSTAGACLLIKLLDVVPIHMNELVSSLMTHKQRLA
jgi:hypothetical protein